MFDGSKDFQGNPVFYFKDTRTSGHSLSLTMTYIYCILYFKKSNRGNTGM